MKLFILAMSFLLSVNVLAAESTVSRPDLDTTTHNFRVIGVKVLTAKYVDVFGPENVLPVMLVKLHDGTVGQIVCSDVGLNEMMFLRDRRAKSSAEFLDLPHGSDDDLLRGYLPMSIPQCEQIFRRIRVGTRISVKKNKYSAQGYLSVINVAQQGADF